MNTIVVCINADRVNADVITNLPLDVYVIHQSDESSAIDMAQVNAKIVRIDYRNGVNGNGERFERYQITLDTKVKRVVCENNEYSVADVNYIDFPAKVFKAQVLNIEEGLAAIYNEAKEQAVADNKSIAFGINEWKAFLEGATLTFDNVFHKQDEEYCDADGVVVGKYQGDCYKPILLDIEFPDDVDEILESYRNIKASVLARFKK